MSHRYTFLPAGFALAGVLGLSLSAACGVKTATGGNAIPAGHGQLVVRLTDAPAPAAKEIVVTVDEVTAHSTSGGWTTVSNQKVTLDLLKLKDSSTELGFVNLPAGELTQVRLHLAEEGPQYVTLQDGSTADLKVPSGSQSGIKVKGPFQLTECQRTEVTLDFDGEKSIKAHPTGGQHEWILRPVIRVKAVQTTPGECTADGGTPDAGQPGTGNEQPKGGSGDSCTAGIECLSGTCTNNTCSPGLPGASCNVNGDCSSQSCVEGSCGPGNAGGTGADCTANSDCLSGSCQNHVCDASGQGNPCSGPSDCAEGFTCGSDGFCQPTVN